MITIYQPTTGNANAYATIGWIGFVGAVSGVNAKGVALSEMGFGNPPGKRSRGTPMPFMLRMCCATRTLPKMVPRSFVQHDGRTRTVYFLGDKHNDPVGW